jgi:hypothetical protein
MARIFDDGHLKPEFVAKTFGAAPKSEPDKKRLMSKTAQDRYIDRMVDLYWEQLWATLPRGY